MACYLVNCFSLQIVTLAIVFLPTLPPSHTERKHPQHGCNLLAVNGSAIATYGKCSLTLNLGLRRTFWWVFIVANVQFPGDFLRHYSLLVNIKRSRL